jgi:hypothetical protein
MMKDLHIYSIIELSIPIRLVQIGIIEGLKW